MRLVIHNNFPFNKYNIIDLMFNEEDIYIAIDKDKTIKISLQPNYF